MVSHWRPHFDAYLAKFDRLNGQLWSEKYSHIKLIAGQANEIQCALDGRILLTKRFPQKKQWSKQVQMKPVTERN